ncbi:MAG: ATP-binding protein, partial [Rhodopila sp.]
MTAAERTGPVISGGGGMGALVRAYPWASSPIGDPGQWPQTLRSFANAALNCAFPVLLWWGPDLVKIYNDAYVGILGNKHPFALGRPGREVWPEIWNVIGSMLNGVMQRGEATRAEDLFLPLERHGYPEECYFSFSYSPILDERGAVGGVFCPVIETTDRVLNERRVGLLREIADRGARPNAPEEFAQAAMACLVEAGLRDFLFGALYLRSESGAAELAATSLPPEWTDPVPLDADQWGVLEILASGQPRLYENALTALPQIGTGPWRLPPKSVLVLPLAGGSTGSLGVVLLAATPHRPLDEVRAHAELLASQIASGLLNARAYRDEWRRAEALAELDRAKTVFFSNVSHEFRTPLALLRAPIEDLLDATRSADRTADRELVKIAYRSTLRLQKLVDTLLEFSRLEAGRMRACFAPVDLAALTADLASNFRSATERAGLSLTIEAAPMPAPAYVDCDIWEKIVLNLLSNAFKFTLQGGIRVAIQPSADGLAAEVAVSDTGIGVAPDALPHLFERFYRTTNTRGRSFEGSGIGLALVHDLVALHGGRVMVDSQLDRGSTFTVSIPFRAAHLPADQVMHQAAASAAGGRAELFIAEALRWLPLESQPAPATVETALAVSNANEGGRVLVADDNADMRDYLARLLSTAGFKVELAPDGEAALAATRADRPDLVVADVMMPKRDGFGLPAAVRRELSDAQLPVVLISARAGEEARLQAMAAGADDYLVKPFNARELVARVAASIRLARVRRGVERRLAGQKDILEMIATGSPLEATLDAIAQYIEGQEAGVVACILPVALDGRHLMRSRGKGLPDTYHSTIEGHPLAPPFASACAEALARGEPVAVPDIAAETAYGPQWQDMLLSLGLRSIRSTPIMGADHEALAALAIYYREARDPTPADPGLLDTAAHLASIALEWHRNENALQETAARLRRAQQAGQITHWSWDLGSDAITSEGEIEAVYGIAPANKPRTATAFFARVPPGDRARLMAELAPVLEGPLDRFDTGFPFRDDSGQMRWIAARAEVVARSAAGQALKIVGVNFDLTARRRTEDALRELTATLEERIAAGLEERRLLADLVEGTDAFVQVVDTEYRFLAINKASADEYERIFGIRPKVGDSLLDVLASQPEHQAAVKAVWSRALGGEAFTAIGEFGNPNRARCFYETKYNILRDRDGQRIGAYVFAYDVTDRIATERQLAEAQAQLHEVQKLETIGQLTGGIAHDFNNLLTPIVTGLELLHRRYHDDGRSSRLIAVGLQAAERARTLVARLLSFARRQALEAQAVNIPDLVRGMTELIDRPMGPRIRLVLDLPDNLPPAMVDPNQLELALLNLSVNARDAMPAGGVLRISAAKADMGGAPDLAPGHYVRVSVSDTGVGMDPETLRRAIEPFYTTKDVGKG